MSGASCPMCGAQNVEVSKIDPGFRVRLNEVGTDPPDVVCGNCLRQLQSQASAGSALRREQEVKENNRTQLWKGRMQLVKQAKAHLAAKRFSEAAVAYEKYIRSIEIVYDKPVGGLTPGLFSGPTAKNELAVIAGVYWDLLNIYDSSSRYGDRQTKIALKLAEFARFTPLFSSIVRQADRRTRDAKNPEAFRLFLKESDAKRPRCFIAGAAFGDRPFSPVVLKLRVYRETVLRPRWYGRLAIFAYELASPPLASAVRRIPPLQRFLRAGLLWAVRRQKSNRG